ADRPGAAGRTHGAARGLARTRAPGPGRPRRAGRAHPAAGTRRASHRTPGDARRAACPLAPAHRGTRPVIPMSIQTRSLPWGGEVRATAVLATPLVFGHLATGMIGFVDSVIAGRHGTTTLAAVSVGTAMFWLPMMIPMGTLMALPP